MSTRVRYPRPLLPELVHADPGDLLGAYVELHAWDARSRQVCTVRVSPEDYGFAAPRILSVMKIGYATFSESGQRRYLHRAICRPPEGLQTDHRNGDPLDCRRGNLRPCTRSQNLANRCRPTGKRAGRSAFRGVRGGSGRWYGMLTHGGRPRYLGSFATEVAAAQAYDTAAFQHFGPFARLNFPPSPTSTNQEAA